MVERVLLLLEAGGSDSRVGLLPGLSLGSASAGRAALW